MLEDINLKNFPKESGVYWIISNDEIVYVGSTNNLYSRIKEHRAYITKGINAKRNPALYQFLQTNQFTVQFQLTENYRQKEQKLIEQYNPKYNSHKAFAGLGARKDRVAEYDKEYKQKFKEQINKHQKQYNNQLCSYNGETLTLNALSMRFKRKGISKPTVEAKKYLI